MKKLIVLLVLISSVCFGDIIVDHAGGGDHLTIQAASNGDTVVVMQGTYIENIIITAKSITLRSTAPTNPAVITSTIIDGNQTGSVITCNEGVEANTIISGFVITNGSGTVFGDYTYGGGMYNESFSPTVSNCTFCDNTADFGGGMYNISSGPSVSNCTFSGNTADTGGGMYNWASGPSISNCTFSDNTAIYGGGMTNEYCSSPKVENCTFSNNAAEVGGGICNTMFCLMILENCTFSGNTAEGVGGGIINIGPSITVQNCAFRGNTAVAKGGGMHNINNSSPMVTGSIFCMNTPDQISRNVYSDGGGNVLNDLYCPSPRVIVEGDLTGDGKVDMADLAELAANWLVGVE